MSPKRKAILNHQDIQELCGRGTRKRRAPARSPGDLAKRELRQQPTIQRKRFYLSKLILL